MNVEEYEEILRQRSRRMRSAFAVFAVLAVCLFVIAWVGYQAARMDECKRLHPVWYCLE